MEKSEDLILPTFAFYFFPNSLANMPRFIVLGFAAAFVLSVSAELETVGFTLCEELAALGFWGAGGFTVAVGVLFGVLFCVLALAAASVDFFAGEAGFAEAESFFAMVAAASLLAPDFIVPTLALAADGAEARRRSLGLYRPLIICDTF